MSQEVKRFSDMGISQATKRFVGDKIKISKTLDIEIMIHFYEIKPSKYPERGSENCLYLQISIEGVKHVAFSISKYLMKTIQQVPEPNFPFLTKIVKEDDAYILK